MAEPSGDASAGHRALPRLQPAPPPVARTCPARPQSNRFLKETLVKLSDDSVRVGKRLIGPEFEHQAASPSLRAQTPLSLPEQAAYIPAWEASMRNTPSPLVTGACAADMSLAACERAAAAAAATAATASPYTVRDAMLAVANVIAHWEQSTSKVADTWARHMDQQSERHEFSDDRWDTMRGQLSGMAEQLERLTAQIADRTSVAEVFETEQRSANSRLESLIERLSHDVAEAATVSCDQAAATVQGAAEHAAAARAHVEALVIGPDRDASAEAPRPIGDMVAGLREQLATLTTAAVEDTAQWRTTADRWHKEKEDAVAAAEAARVATAGSEAALARIQEDVESMRRELTAAREAIDKMKKAPASQALSQVQVVEKRGHIRLDRRSGQVEVLGGGMDFVVPKTPGKEEPLATFKDAASAERVLADVAELWTLFDGPVDLEMQFRAGKGGNTAWWNAQAAAQAAFLKDKLESAGVDAMMISTTVSQGADTNARIVFKRDVFEASSPVAPAPSSAPEKKGERRPAGKSPRRA